MAENQTPVRLPQRAAVVKPLPTHIRLPQRAEAVAGPDRQPAGAPQAVAVPDPRTVSQDAVPKPE
jgi:hypothetical protein